MKNKLIQYQGGGYDGCFWEWNFCMYDEDGKWHDIFSSGHAGIKNERQLKQFLAGIDKEARVKHYIYDLKSKKSWKEFLTETNVVLVLGITKDLNKKHGYELPVMCSCCKELIPADDIYEMELVDWHGCGGIASTADNLICHECQSNYACRFCNDFIGKEKFEKETINGACFDCYEKMIKENVKNAEYIYLELDKIHNRLFESDDFDTDFDRDNKYFYVTIYYVGGEKSYVIEGINQDAATIDVLDYFKKNVSDNFIRVESGKLDEIFEDA